MLKVVYLIKKSGVLVTKEFDSEYLCRKLVDKLKRSKTCSIVSCPLLSW